MSVLYRLNTTAMHCGCVLKPSAVVLMYHRVAELASDPQLLTQFRRAISRHYHLKHVAAAACHSLAPADRASAIMARRAAGYRHHVRRRLHTDNFTQAAPLLQASRLPTTVFVAAAVLDTPQEFWWDELERLLLLPGKVPETVTLAVHNQPICWGNLAQPQSIPSKTLNTAHGTCCRRTRRRRVIAFTASCTACCIPLMPRRGGRFRRLREWAGQSPDRRVTHRTATSAQCLS